MKREIIHAAPVFGSFSDYLGQQETSILVHLVKSVSPKVMIEFGCNKGVTALRLLDNVPTLEKYIGIDVPRGHVTTLECQQTEVPLAAGCYGAWDNRFSVLTMQSTEIFKEDLEPCDAVFIDGDHSKDAVLYDSCLSRQLVRRGGIIVWHDYDNPAVEVTAALDKLEEEGWPIASVVGSWLAFMKVGES
jgi:predicted O-methyltransferase YrrM